MMLYFDPVDYSLEENEFLIASLGQPPIVALASKPAKVNVNAVKPILERVFELQQLEQHNGEKWVGVEPLKEAAKVYLTQYAKWKSDRRRGAPKFPSMFSYDSKGRPHRQGPESDSGKVRTYFSPDGKRHSFRIELIPSYVGDWVADWGQKVGKVDADSSSDGLLNDEEKFRYECLVCHHTENYKASSRSSQNAARARMSKHFRKGAGDADIDARHREAHTNIFGQQG